MQVSERKMNLIEFESHNKLHASSDFLGSENKVPNCHCIAATAVGADTDGLLEEGPIGLQLHGGKEMSIEFRNMKVAKL